MTRILAVIPARGGSKGIRRKNMRFLNNHPLIYYPIRTALECRHIDNVVITSDDEDILNYCSQYPVCLRKRPLELATDEVPLDPVVYDAVVFAEKQLKTTFDSVVTLQPTSPLLTPKTLENAICLFIKEDIDTLISVVDATHLYWLETDGKVVPEYSERLNRQWLPKKYKEAGAFLISKRSMVTEVSRFGHNVKIYPLNYDEGLDIDSPSDWLTAEALIKKTNIVIVVNGNGQIGLGHIHRAVALSSRLIGHNVTFVTYDSDKPAIEILEKSGIAVINTNKLELSKCIFSLSPDIVVNDILDTSEAYIRLLKQENIFVVNFEDLGEGANYADLVFNDLYDMSEPKQNFRFGHKYAFIGDTFMIHPPIKFKKRANALLITFGGVDENDLTLKTIEIIPDLIKNCTIKNIIVIVGAGYRNYELMRKKVDYINKHLKIRLVLYKNVQNMSHLMSLADVAVTSNGRTIYELTVMGVPTISIAQNDRETMHLFARYHKGINYLGIASNLNSKMLLTAISNLFNAPALRKSMHRAQLDAGNTIRNASRRVLDEIFSNYERYLNDKNRKNVSS